MTSLCTRSLIDVSLKHKFSVRIQPNMHKSARSGGFDTTTPMWSVQFV